MVNYIFNGVELTAFPTIDTSIYQYAIVLDVSSLKSSNFNYDYAAIFCSQAFVYKKGLLNEVVVETIGYPVSSKYIAYACRTTSTAWVKVSLSSSDNNSAEYAAIPSGSNYVWTSHDIINEETNEVEYEATEIERRIFAATPTISYNFNKDKEYIFYQNDYITSFRISASSADGESGIISYQWYMIENEIPKIIENECSNVYTPSTENLGTYQFYCIVTNTYDTYTAQKESDIITVIIRSIESVIPKKSNFNHQSFSLGWVIGKILQYIIRMDSEFDNSILINDTLLLFDGNATVVNNILEVV